MEMEALGGSYYFMSLIDDYSRRIWISFLKTTDQALGKFKEWHVMVANESRRKLKMVRSDRGGEFTSGEFDGYCKSHGIEAETSPTYT